MGNSKRPACYLLSDNGSQFLKGLETERKRCHITHWLADSKVLQNARRLRTFPPHQSRLPSSIAEELLFTDVAIFNNKLVDWLVFYNTE